MKKEKLNAEPGENCSHADTQGRHKHSMEMCDVVCGQFVRRVKEQVDGCVHVEMVVIRFLFSAFFEKKNVF